MAGLVDFHTRFCGRALFDALADLSPQPGERDDKLRRTAAGAGLELPPEDLAQHVDRWLAELDACNVARAVSIADVPAEVAPLTEAASLSGDRLLPFAVFDPTVDRAAERARGLFEQSRFHGLVLLPALHHYRLDGPELSDVLDAVQEFSPCVAVTCGLLRLELRDLFLIPRRYRLDLADPLHLVPTADRFPRTRFVLQRLGGGRLREALMAGAQCRNVFAETAGIETWLFSQPDAPAMADVLERVIGVFGPDHVLFGTGSSTFPPGWRRVEFTLQREALGACGLDERERELIFGGNAVRILGLDG